ncbi:hypothetical protein BDV19DRAFT_373095 [Aspergillus venezuelensis]
MNDSLDHLQKDCSLQWTCPIFKALNNITPDTGRRAISSIPACVTPATAPHFVPRDGDQYHLNSDENQKKQNGVADEQSSPGIESPNLYNSQPLTYTKHMRCHNITRIEVWLEVYPRIPDKPFGENVQSQELKKSIVQHLDAGRWSIAIRRARQHLFCHASGIL